MIAPLETCRRPVTEPAYPSSFRLLPSEFALFYAQPTSPGSPDPVTSSIPHHRPDWTFQAGFLYSWFLNSEDWQVEPRADSTPLPTPLLAEKEYLIRLGGRARKRHYHKTDQGQVVAFMVQLEIEVEGGVWKPAIRYDCAHNFAHRDRYNLKGDRDKEKLLLSYTDSLDLADKDINANWDIYQERFLRGDFP